MPGRDPRCPVCGRAYAWGVTVCPACHVGLDLFGDGPRTAAPEAVVFETGDRASAEIVASLLAAHQVPCALRGSDDSVHLALGRMGSWRVLVRGEDEARAQSILDAEIGSGGVE